MQVFKRKENLDRHQGGPDQVLSEFPLPSSFVGRKNLAGKAFEMLVGKLSGWFQQFIQ
jgi:hypothetical protein